MIADMCYEPISPQARCQLLADHIVPHSENPDDNWIPLPKDPWNEIAPRLWQGGSHTGSRYYDPAEGGFRSVLTLYRNAPFAEPPVNERRFPFNDGDEIPAGLDDAADWVYMRWMTHQDPVLVRCQGGLNRSGLIIALVLHRDGYDMPTAIETIRARRSPYALCNTTFVAYLESLG